MQLLFDPTLCRMIGLQRLRDRENDAIDQRATGPSDELEHRGDVHRLARSRIGPAQYNQNAQIASPGRSNFTRIVPRDPVSVLFERAESSRGAVHIWPQRRRPEPGGEPSGNSDELQ